MVVFRRLAGTCVGPTAENPTYQDIVIVEGMQFEVVGVCTNVIHSLK